MFPYNLLSSSMIVTVEPGVKVILSKIPPVGGSTLMKKSSSRRSRMLSSTIEMFIHCTVSPGPKVKVPPSSK